MITQQKIRGKPEPFTAAKCSNCGTRVNALGRAIDGGLHPGKACQTKSALSQKLIVGQSVFVDAHGMHGEDFSGTIVRIDDDNYLIFVEAPDGETYGCTRCFVYPTPGAKG